MPNWPVWLDNILVPLGIGLAIFLFGLKAMEIGLHAWAGPFLTRFITQFTDTPFKGLLTGMLATFALQSSSAVTVITIGLVNAGVLSFRQTLGIVLGANIGASLTADMLGLDLTGYAFALLMAAGAIWMLFIVAIPMFPRLTSTAMRRLAAAAPAIRCLSLAVSGFACILIGMEWMDSVVPSLQERGLFIWFVEQSQQSLIWGVAAGSIVTAVIQSSSATITVTMGLAAVQAITVEIGIAIVLGANIGTCSTAFLACIGGSRSGKYVAYSNILLNLGGSLLFFPLIAELHALSSLGQSSPYDQIARAQTLFNVLCSAVALPFCYINLNKPPTRS